MSARTPQPMRGFTIIELMLAVVILAIVVAIGAPSFNDLILGTRVKNAASDIYATLIFARSEAIKRSTNVAITPVGGQWVNGWTVSVGGVTLKTQDAISSLKIECPSGTSCTQTVTYRRDGRLNAVSSSLAFVVDEATPPAPRRVAMRCVTVSPSGQINVLADNNLDGDCNNG
jgi:type IV fimbrial biogenesis protein FimT